MPTSSTRGGGHCCVDRGRWGHRDGIPPAVHRHAVRLVHTPGDLYRQTRRRSTRRHRSNRRLPGALLRNRPPSFPARAGTTRRSDSTSGQNASGRRARQAPARSRRPAIGRRQLAAGGWQVLLTHRKPVYRRFFRSVATRTRRFKAWAAEATSENCPIVAP